MTTRYPAKSRTVWRRRFIRCAAGGEVGSSAATFCHASGAPSGDTPCNVSSCGCIPVAESCPNKPVSYTPLTLPTIYSV